MPNRQLTKKELGEIFQPLFKNIANDLIKSSGKDKELLWALRRKLAKELIYEERGKPAHRRRLKGLKRKKQNGLCAVCKSVLPEKNTILDRFEAMKGYTEENTRLICGNCDFKIQSERKFK